jgi:chromosomal replication initiator protein
MVLAQTATRRSDDQRIWGELERRLGGDRLRRFPHRAVRLEPGAGGVRVVAATAFHLEWVRERFGADIEAAADAPVHWEVGASAPGPATRTAPASAARPPAGPHAAPRLRIVRPPLDRGDVETFPEFEVSPANRYAAAWAWAIAAEPEPGFAVLTLHGGCGVGKTHLLRAVAAEASARGRAASVRHVTGERFAGEFIAAIRADRMDAFRARYRQLALLCVDDLDDLAGKPATQQEMRQTIDAVVALGGRVAATMRDAPCACERLQADLRSRLSGGMVERLEAPDLETRGRLAERFAARRGLRLGEGVARLLAARSPGGVRELEGMLARVEACGRLLGERPGAEVDEAMVRRALGAGAPAAPRRPRRFEPIAERVCERLGVELSEALGRGRHGRVVLARGLICVLARELTTLSYPELARRLGRRNHSTVITARQRTLRQIEAGATVPAAAGLGDVGVASLYEELRRDPRVAG